MTNIIEISPYVARSAEKAALIGKSADHCERDYRFARQQKLYTPPLEKTPVPLKSWLREITRACIAVALVVSGWWGYRMIYSEPFMSWTPPLMDRPQGKQDHHASVRNNAVRLTVLDSGERVGPPNFMGH